MTETTTTDRANDQTPREKGLWRAISHWMQTFWNNPPPPRDEWERRRRAARSARRHATRTKFPIPHLWIPKRRKKPKRRRKPSWRLTWPLLAPDPFGELRLTGERVVVGARKDSRGNVEIMSA